MFCILDFRSLRPILVPLNNDEIDNEVDQSTGIHGNLIKDLTLFLGFFWYGLTLLRYGFGHSLVMFRSLRPIIVPLNNDEIDKEVDQAHQRKEQVKEVQIVAINIIPYQPFSTVSNRMVIVRINVKFDH
ncbi:uncharacterized protein G2W53_010766 [Senna tora]|uniref:Uncharacterized protein n=1 Tax=Senna tora TaxID=362788 RepID=A0A835CEF4_9FABA|nr:uncharacterized protein G2W53_010766 [Senna tora]